MAMGLVNFLFFTFSSLEVTAFLGLLLGLFFYFKYMKVDARVEGDIDKLPGPPLIPIIGNAFAFAVSSTELIGIAHDMVEQYGPVIRLWLFNKPYVLLTSAPNIEKVLSSPAHLDKGAEYFAFKPWLGNALNLVNGRDWVARRKLLNSAFAFKFMGDFMEVFNEQSVIMKSVLEKECVDKGLINLFPYCCRCTLDVICASAMGTKISSQTDKNLEYLQSIVSVTQLIVKRILRPWLHPDLIWNLSLDGRAEKKELKILHGMTDKLIAERREILLKTKQLGPLQPQDFQESHDMIPKKRRLAFLDNLLEMAEGGKVLKDSDIRNETDLFMAAGHDTSGSLLAWSLFMLARDPKIQGKVQHELDEIFEGDFDRHVTMTDLTRMKYMDLCIKETLRLCPSVPVVFRNLGADLELADGKIVPGGTTVVMSILELHRDAQNFPDPMKFDPDRFKSENCVGRNPFAYIPFAGGPRNCIGMRYAQMEVKVILSTLLRYYSFEAKDEFASIKLEANVALRPPGGLYFQVKKRC